MDDIETDTEVDKHGCSRIVCRCSHCSGTDIIQNPSGSVPIFIGICVSLDVGQCEYALHGELFIRSFLIFIFYRRDALHHPSDRVAAVMGMDMTLGYFYKLIVQQIPVCEKENIRCFIMDDRGYLIAHKGTSAVYLFRVSNLT